MRALIGTSAVGDLRRVLHEAVTQYWLTASLPISENLSDPVEAGVEG